MTTDAAPDEMKYKVNCQSCGGKFDALRAPWCNCLTKERTVRCHHCNECFCKSSAAVKQQFWADAPEAMWARKRELKQEKPFANPSPADVTRPLVLIVEDEKEIQSIAMRVVNALGYGAVLARDGEEGLALAAEYRPDIVLTDAMMPKLDGREMCRRIKDDPQLGSTKVAIMTSLYTSAQYKYEALKEFKADAYAAKPLDPAQLREILKKLAGL
jgi:CheY-like chemotaxis protein